MLTPYDPDWRRRFDEAAEELGRLLREAVVAVHHVGSTAVDTVDWSKPVIDILVEVGNLSSLDRPLLDRLAAHGFEDRGEYGIPGRRYFVRARHGDRPRTHVHCYRVGDARIERHLRFRDYLRHHGPAAEAYSDLKRRLASAHRLDKAGYQAGKAEFIARIERMAGEPTGAREGRR